MDSSATVRKILLAWRKARLPAKNCAETRHNALKGTNHHQLSPIKTRHVQIFVLQFAPGPLSWPPKPRNKPPFYFRREREWRRKLYFAAYVACTLYSVSRKRRGERRKTTRLWTCLSGPSRRTLCPAASASRGGRQPRAHPPSIMLVSFFKKSASEFSFDLLV